LELANLERLGIAIVASSGIPWGSNPFRPSIQLPASFVE
jgi:hypothetical protein